jgi:hypothetical protein
MFSDQSGTKREVKYRMTTRKYSNIWKLNNRFLNNPWVKEEVTLVLDTRVT